VRSLMNLKVLQSTESLLAAGELKENWRKHNDEIPLINNLQGKDTQISTHIGNNDTTWNLIEPRIMKIAISPSQKLCQLKLTREIITRKMHATNFQTDSPGLDRPRCKSV